MYLAKNKMWADSSLKHSKDKRPVDIRKCFLMFRKRFLNYGDGAALVAARFPGHF